jgi:hypothetical protein
MRVSDRLALRHVVVRSRQRRLLDEVEKNAVTNYCADSHTWFLAVRDALLAHGVDTTYDGIAGDVLSSSTFLTPERDQLYREERYGELADELLGSAEDWLKELLSRSCFPLVPRDQAKERLIKELRSHASSPNPVAAFYFWNRTRRVTALCPYAILSGIPFVFSPFVDEQLFDFMTSLPASHFIGRSFHTEAINRAFPDCVHLPYAPRGSGRQIVGSLRRSTVDLVGAVLRRRVFLLRRDRVVTRLGAALAGVSPGEWWFRQASYLIQLEEAVSAFGNPRLE